MERDERVRKTTSNADGEVEASGLACVVLALELVRVQPPLDIERTVLFQPFNKVKIGEEAAVAVCVGHAVGSGKNRTNVFHTCGVWGHELLPEGSAAAGDFQAVNLGRQLTSAVDV